jgi:hypothetical protein
MIGLSLHAFRRRIALWLCPELEVRAAQPVFDPSSLPVFRGHYRPVWWRNEALRSFLTESHRRQTLEETRALAVEKFGDGVPSVSAIHRYWTRLDELKAASRPDFTQNPKPMEAIDG